MKKLMTLALVLTLALCTLVPVAQASAASVRIRNETDVTIYYLYLSPSYSDSWGVDQLNSDEVLRRGDTHRITFSNGIPTRYWDMRIEDRNGEYVTWQDIDLYSHSVLSIYENSNGGYTIRCE